MGIYKVSRASVFIKDEEHEIEFIEMPGYDKEDKKWYRSIKNIITTCYNMTYKRKREKKYDMSGDCEKSEYDFNVWSN